MDEDMPLVAYRSYRLYMTLNRGGNNGYMAVSEWKMYSDEEGLGPNVLVGGVPSANLVNGSYAAANAFDNNENTTWESTSISGPKWLRYDLPEPVVVRCIYLSHHTWPNERPSNFVLQGSNDGESWDELAVFTGFGGSNNSGKSSIVRKITGRSVTSDGRANTRVHIYEWSTGALIGLATPNVNGDWGFTLPSGTPVLLVHVTPTGFRPSADGPIQTVARW